MPQPSEMIKRVARALSHNCHEGCEGEGVIAGCNPDYCACLRDARVAIQAMIDPTEAMRDIIARGINDDLPTEQIWEGAIDTALKGA